MITKPIASGTEAITIDFVPRNGEDLIMDAGLDFDIITDEGVTEGAGASDLIGNEMSRTYTVQIFD